MKQITKSGFRIGLFIYFILFGLMEFNISKADSIIPPVSSIEEEFNQSTNENARFQIFDKIGKYAEPIVKENKEVEYVTLLKRFFQVSQDKGDSAWVYQRVQQIIGVISELKIQKFNQVDHMVIPTMALCDQFATYLVATGEGFQHRYLSEIALQYIMSSKDVSLFEDYYKCIYSIKAIIPEATPKYIGDDYDLLMSTMGLVYLMNFKKLDQAAIDPWLTRIQPNGIQRLLTSLRDQLVTATSEDLPMIRKIMTISKYFYQILWSKYSNDPYNDWQFKTALHTINDSLLKMRKYNWPIPQEDIEFIVENHSPAELMDFSEKYGMSVTESAILSKLIAAQLLPSFGVLDLNLRKKNIDTRVFPVAYGLIQTLAYTKIELEGVYKIDLPGFKTLTIAFVNDKVLSAGLHSDNDNKNLGFQQVLYDVESQSYKAQVEKSSTLSVLTFKLNDGVLEGCLNFTCFKGRRTIELPNYLSLSDNRKEGPEFEVTGVYKGQITLSNGQTKPVSLTISYLNNLIADFGLDYLHIHQSYQNGLKNHNLGIVYLSTNVNYLGVLNFIRGSVERINGVFQFRGLWFSSNRGEIATLSLRKISDL